MITCERALETLQRFDIDEDQIIEWEDELGLEIELDEFGNKVYTQQHINLFKNIKKHLTLGRTLTEIKRMVVLPPSATRHSESPIGMADPFGKAPKVETVLSAEESALSQRLMNELKPVTPKKSSQSPVSAGAASPFAKATSTPKIETPPVAETVTTASVEVEPTATASVLPVQSEPETKTVRKYVSAPAATSVITPSTYAEQGPNAGLLALIDRLMAEKDFLQSKLIHTEKQRAHLLNANEMFQKRVKELGTEIEILQEQLKVQENFKLIDDKSRLQKLLIEAEHRQGEADKQVDKLNTEVRQLRDSLSSAIDPKIYIGNWLEESDLQEVVFDNFGINIESKRNRMFKITLPPERFFGHTAIIETTYDYQTNTLWKRSEMLILNIATENRLEGELITEFFLDGTPVARAIYKVKCHRNGQAFA